MIDASGECRSDGTLPSGFIGEKLHSIVLINYSFTEGSSLCVETPGESAPPKLRAFESQAISDQ
jgi:hypothetical protein